MCLSRPVIAGVCWDDVDVLTRARCDRLANLGQSWGKREDDPASSRASGVQSLISLVDL